MPFAVPGLFEAGYALLVERDTGQTGLGAAVLDPHLVEQRAGLATVGIVGEKVDVGSLQIADAVLERHELGTDPTHLIVQVVDPTAQLAHPLIAETVLQRGLSRLFVAQLRRDFLEALFTSVLAHADGVVDADLHTPHQGPHRRDEGVAEPGVHATSSIRPCAAHARSSAPSAARRCSGVTATAGPHPCANSVWSGRSATVVPVSRTAASGNSSVKT